ncbi:MAG TPA: transposase [Chloroflexia bacterium]|nr:transposase [Chloroflexia bacterium]
MRRSYTQLYLHCVWATWNRLPLITPAIEGPVYAVIIGKAKELGCVPLAIGGVEDHVHFLLRFPATLTVAFLIQEVKGASSHHITNTTQPDVFFKWQGSYGAFTLQKDGIPALQNYVQHQKTHHATQNLVTQWEHTDSQLAVED